MNRSGLWDDEDGFFYDALKVADGSSVAIKVHSMVGLIPLLPAAVVPPKIVARNQHLGKRFASLIEGSISTDGSARRFRHRSSGARKPAC